MLMSTKKCFRKKLQCFIRSSSEDEPPAPKRSKLFSFKAVEGKVRKRPKRNCEQEIQLYLGDVLVVNVLWGVGS